MVGSNSSFVRAALIKHARQAMETVTHDPCVLPMYATCPKLQAHGAKLRVKYEHDVHCDHDHTTLSPMYHPVPGNMNISTLTHVRCYFPNLAEVMSLDEHEQLPFMHQFFLAKTVWTVRYSGVIGEVCFTVLSCSQTNHC